MGRRRGQQWGGPTQTFCSERGLGPEPTSLSLEIPQHGSPKGTLCGRVTLGCPQDACSELEARGREASSSIGPVRAVPNIQRSVEPIGRQMGSVPRQGAVLFCSLPPQRCSLKLKSPSGGGGCGAAPSPLACSKACVGHAQDENRHRGCGARLGSPRCPAGCPQGFGASLGKGPCPTVAALNPLPLRAVSSGSPFVAPTTSKILQGPQTLKGPPAP